MANVITKCREQRRKDRAAEKRMERAARRQARRVGSTVSGVGHSGAADAIDVVRAAPRAQQSAVQIEGVR